MQLFNEEYFLNNVSPSVSHCIIYRDIIQEETHYTIHALFLVAGE